MAQCVANPISTFGSLPVGEKLTTEYTPAGGQDRTSHRPFLSSVEWNLPGLNKNGLIGLLFNGLTNFFAANDLLLNSAASTLASFSESVVSVPIKRIGKNLYVHFSRGPEVLS